MHDFVSLAERIGKLKEDQQALLFDICQLIREQLVGAGDLELEWGSGFTYTDRTCVYRHCSVYLYHDGKLHASGEVHGDDTEFILDLDKMTDVDGAYELMIAVNNAKIEKDLFAQED